MAARGWLAIGLFACVACSGCGSSDRDAARIVTQRFFAALQRHDGKTACAQISPDTRTSLESQEGKRCADAILGMNVSPASIDRVSVYLTNAKVDLSDGESAFLGESPQGWRLSAFGCKPTAGKPSDRPYDCQAQA